MSDLFDTNPFGAATEASVQADLERAVRKRGVRVEQRLALLRELGEPGGEQALEARIDVLESRIREASRKVARALRGGGQ